jgi:hypothetical protein
MKWGAAIRPDHSSVATENHAKFSSAATLHRGQLPQPIHPVNRLLPLFFLLLARAVAADASPLAGTWKFDAAHSTELSPWKTYELTIAVAGPAVTIDRKLAWGRRDYTDRLALDLTQPETAVIIDWWPDNRHLGAYVGDNKTKRVRATLLDDGRILRLSADLMLETQQGPRAVNVLSDYKVSANGAQLTLTELRSTRNRPVVYVFTRAAK